MAQLLDCVVVDSLEVIDPTLILTGVSLNSTYLTKGGMKIPALTATWATIANPYVTGIQFEYGPSNLSQGITKSDANKGALSWVRTDGVIAGEIYTVRYRAIGDGVFGPWSNPANVEAGAEWLAGGISGTVDWTTQVAGDNRPADNAGTALTLGIFPAAGFSVRGNRSTKTAGGVNWSMGVYSRQSYIGGAIAQSRIEQTNHSVMVGLTDDPTASANYANIDYAIYAQNNGALLVYESGTPVNIGGPAYVAGDLLSVVYDGFNVRYYQNTTLLRTVATTPGRRFHLQVSHGTGGGSVSDLFFGPANNAAILGTNVLSSTGASQTDGTLITSQGTAALIAGQGAFATLSQAPPSRLTLTDASNLILDSDFSDPAAWSFGSDFSIVTGGAGAVALGRPRALKTSDGDGTTTMPTPRVYPTPNNNVRVEPGDTLFASVRSWVPAGFNGIARIYITWLDGNLAGVGSQTSIFGPDYRVTPAAVATETTISGRATAPAGARWARMELLVNRSASLPAAGAAWFADYRLLPTQALGRTIVRNDRLTPVGDADAITNLGTAALIAGQGAFATLAQITAGNIGTYVGPNAVDYARLSTTAVRFGGNVRRADGTTLVGDADAITSLGTAALIAGQGALATQATVRVSQMPPVSGPNLVPDPYFTDETATTLTSNTSFSTDAAMVTALVAPKGIKIDLAGIAAGGSARFSASERMPVDPGKRYWVKSDFHIKAGFNGYARAFVYWYKADGTPSAVNANSGIFSTAYDFRTAPAGVDTTGSVSGIVQAPSDAAYAIYRTLRVDPSATLAGAGVAYGANPVMRAVSELGLTVVRETGVVLTDSDAVTSLGTAALIAGQGPGATATGPQVLNNRLEGGVLAIPNPEGAALSLTSAQTGAVKIVLPVTTDTMFQMDVDIYEYGSQLATRYQVGGYLYAGGPNRIINWFARISGTRARTRPVRFGYDAALAKYCIWIGTPTDSWSYPGVRVRNFIASYGNTTESAWRSGWSVTMSTAAQSYGTDEVAIPLVGQLAFGEGGILEAGTGTGAGVTATRANFRTDQGTAALVAGQGAWATYSGLVPTNVANQIQHLNGSGNLGANRVYYTSSGTPLVDSLRPAEAGANITENRTAALIAGQGPWATYGTHAPADIAPRVAAGLASNGDVARNIPLAVLNGSDVMRRTGGGLYVGDLDGVGSAYVDNSVGTLENDLITGALKPAEAATFTGKGALAEKDVITKSDVTLNSIIAPTLSSPSGTVTTSGATSASSYVLVFQVEVTTAGEPLMFLPSFLAKFWHPGGGDFSFTLRFIRLNGGLVRPDVVISAINGDQYHGWQTPWFCDTPPAGTHTYEIRAWASTDSGFTHRDFSDRQMLIIKLPTSTI